MKAAHQRYLCGATCVGKEKGEGRGELKNRFECNRIALKISTTVNPSYACYDAMYGGGYLCVCVHARTRVCVYDKKKLED